MQNILYTTTDQVRTALLVSPSDLSDEQLVDRNLDFELVLDLDEWLPTHATIWQEGNDDARTGAQFKRSRLLAMYCQYRSAAWVMESWALGFAEEVTDGKNKMQRFGDGLEEMLEKLRAKADKLKGLLAADAEVALPAAFADFLTGVEPAIDVVTTSPRTSTA